MKRDLIWAACVPTIAAMLAVFAWSFTEWRLPPALPDWEPFARGFTFFGWVSGAGYTLMMRKLTH